MIVLFRKPSGSAAESLGFFLNAGSSMVASGLSGGNVVNLQVKSADDYINVLDDAGAAVTLTATAPQYTLRAAGTYRGASASTSDTVILSCTQAI